MAVKKRKAAKRKAAKKTKGPKRRGGGLGALNTSVGVNPSIEMSPRPKFKD